MKTETFSHISFLWEISKVLSEYSTPQKLVFELRSVFQSFLKIKEMNIWIYDDNTEMIRDFSKSWDMIYDEKLKNTLGKIFYNFSTGKDFIIFEENNIYLPLTDKGKMVGFIELMGFSDKSFLDDGEFILNLKIAANQISTLVINIKLQEQMELSISFHQAMKDIAKIIESQYELKYIIPLIGEMLDKFIPEHLVYIFHKNNNEYNLIWPNAYNEARLKPLLLKLNNNYLISKDKKTAAFPLYTEKKLFGSIAVDGNMRKITSKEMSYLIQLSEQVAITIEKASVYAEILKHATMDALTGLNNRHQFEQRLEQELNKAKRNNTNLCLIMIDIDHFKSINDSYGHLVGDQVLHNIAKIIKDKIRSYDIAARYGGEEFCIILPDITKNKAVNLAERLRKTVEKTKFDISAYNSEVKEISATVSLGVSSYSSDIINKKDLIQKADKALYFVKSQGRNQVHFE